MTPEQVEIVNGLALLAAFNFAVAVQLHNVARSYVNTHALSKWSGQERQMRTFWFSIKMLKPEGLKWAYLRNIATGLGGLLIVIVVLLGYIWSSGV